MLKIVIGIILALAAVALFLNYRGISPWPPVEASFRESKVPFSSSQVLMLQNTSSETELSIEISVYAGKEKDVVFNRSLILSPGDTEETGRLEGWEFSKGETVVVDVKGYILPIRTKVP